MYILYIIIHHNLCRVDMGQYYCDEDEEGVCLYVLVYLVKCACNIIIIQGTN